MIEASERDADVLSEAAREQSIAIEVEFKKLAAKRFGRVDAALRDLVEAAKAELSTRMPAHYLGKHLYASVHFIPSFEKLVKEAERDLDLDLSALSAAVKAADKESSKGPSAGPSGNGSAQFQAPKEPPEYD